MPPEQPRSTSPEDSEQAMGLFRQIIANEWKTKGEQRADLESVHTPFLKEEEMKLFVRLQELMHKDQAGTLTVDEVQDYTREVRVATSAIPAEYSRMRKAELIKRRASDPIVTKYAFYKYLMIELNPPYMRAQAREDH